MVARCRPVKMSGEREEEFGSVVDELSRRGRTEGETATFQVGSTPTQLANMSISGQLWTASTALWISASINPAGCPFPEQSLELKIIAQFSPSCRRTNREDVPANEPLCQLLKPRPTGRTSQPQP